MKPVQTLPIIQGSRACRIDHNAYNGHGHNDLQQPDEAKGLCIHVGAVLKFTYIYGCRSFCDRPFKMYSQWWHHKFSAVKAAHPEAAAAAAAAALDGELVVGEDGVGEDPAAAAAAAAAFWAAAAEEAAAHTHKCQLRPLHV